MKVKKFAFPSFEKWVKKGKKVRIELGAYCCEVRASSWIVISGTCKAASYMFVVSLANLNPFSPYTHKLFCSTYEYDGNAEKLKEWYDKTISEFNIFWDNHVKSTYLDE